MSLTASLEVTYKKQLDLQQLIEGEYIDEDELVEAIEANDSQRIMMLLDNIVLNRHNFISETDSIRATPNESERHIEIQYNGQTLKANL